MKAIILSQEGKIVAANSKDNLSLIVKKFVSSNYQIRHPVTNLPFSVILICSPLKVNRNVNPLVPILFPDIQVSIKGDVVMCKEVSNEYNTISFISFTDEEIETIRQYFLECLTTLKKEIDKERDLYQSMRKDKENGK